MEKNDNDIVYDVYIAYRHGAENENLDKIRPVYDKLTDLGYEVFFDIKDNDNSTNWEQNLTLLKNARLVLVFIDQSVRFCTEEDGFYKEVEAINEKKGLVLAYRYNGYIHVDKASWTKFKKHAYLIDEGTKYEREELDRSVDLVVRDVEKALHGYWPMTFKEYNEKYKQWGKSRRRLFLLLGFSFILAILFLLIAQTQKTKAETNKESRDEVIKACLNITANANNDTKLLIVGGSTVKNYLDTIMNASFIENYPNSLYVHTGSKSAWVLLFEDYLTDTNRLYYPVVLSSEKLNVDTLKVQAGIKDESTVADFNFSRQIRELTIGKAALVVELNPPDKYRGYEKRKTISIDDLVYLVKKSEILYRTTKTSGTLAKFQEIFRQHKDYDSIICKLAGASTFSQNGKKLNKRTVFLTNQYYQTKDTNCIRLNVKDRDNKLCYIDLYIYMLEVQTGNSTQNSKYVMPKPLEDFLKILKGKIDVTEDNISL